MSYFRELRENWRSLNAASIGLGFGHQLTFYILSPFVPHLLKAFGWSRAQISAVGGITILAAICGPICGRLTDIIGVRGIATVGVIAAPLIFLGFSAMTGDFNQYVWLNVAYILFISATTTQVPYSRLIVDQFSRARGLALSIFSCAPPLVGAVTAPILSRLMDAYGWRTGYVAVAAIMGIGGATAILLIPRRAKGTDGVSKIVRPSLKREYGALVRYPAFQIMLVGTFLCNLSFLVQTSQLALVLVDRGMTSTTASFMISIYGVSVVVGRLACGVFLDRYRPHVVAACALGLPAIGLLILGSGLQFIVLIASAVSLLGLSMGSETNLLPFLLSRFVRVEIYGTVLGVLGGMIAVSAASGSLLLSLSQKLTGSFTVFLLSTAVATAVGSALFLLLGHRSVRGNTPAVVVA